MDGNEETVETTAEYPEPEADGAAPGVLREEGVGARNERFDPTPYMRQLRGRGGGGEYLAVKWRLLWLRKEHPDAEIVTEHVQIEPTLAIFKATVTLPSGGMATGYGSETAGDFGDFIEKAETKAIGRALNALGYGAQFGDFQRADDATAAPVAELPKRPVAAPATRPVALPARGEGLQKPTPLKSVPTADAAPSEAPSPAAADPDLVDYSWSAFWPWARERGLNGPREIENLIGQQVAGFSPAELRDFIVAADARR